MFKPTFQALYVSSLWINLNQQVTSACIILVQDFTTKSCDPSHTKMNYRPVMPTSVLCKHRKLTGSVLA